VVLQRLALSRCVTKTNAVGHEAWHRKLLWCHCKMNPSKIWSQFLINMFCPIIFLFCGWITWYRRLHFEYFVQFLKKKRSNCMTHKTNIKMICITGASLPWHRVAGESTATASARGWKVPEENYHRSIIIGSQFTFIVSLAHAVHGTERLHRAVVN